MAGQGSGEDRIQIDLFFDYQNNLRDSPRWQAWLRERKPPLLVVWGRYDLSFTEAGALAAYRQRKRFPDGQPPSIQLHWFT